MRKVLPLLFLLISSVATAQTQTPLTTSQARENEWNNYKLPATDFVRHTSAEKELLFRVPADWKQEGETLTFHGPHESYFRVMVQKVPDGYPLQEFFNVMVRTVKDLSGSSEPMVVRRTKLQDVEARELSLEGPNTEGDDVRSTTWVCVKGPAAITFNLQVPIAHAAELGPYFKAIVQSVIFVPSFEYNYFNSLKPATVKAIPGPVNTIQEAVTTIDQVGTPREETIQKLAAIFAATPDIAIDLLLDKRPLIRAAAVKAMAQSNNRALDPFLWDALDEDALVAEPAARRLATTPNLPTELLNHSMSGVSTESIGRLWPFMTPAQRVEVLQMIFSKPAIRPSAPPPVRSSKPGATVIVTELAPVAIGKSATRQYPSLGMSQAPNVQLGALTLLKTMTPEEFKLPLAQLMASNHDPLILAGLQVSLARKETVPVELLFKLATSANNEVKLAAIQNLGISARTSDILRIEGLESKAKAAQQKSPSKVGDEIKLTIKKIRFRDELSLAGTSESATNEVIQRGLCDVQLATFVWELRGAKTPTSVVKLPSDFRVKDLGENILPKNVNRFLAIPNSDAAIQKPFETINGIQMDSARAQSNLVLVMGGLRQALAGQLGAPPEAASIFNYTGIAPNSAITIADWTEANAPPNVNTPTRTAVICRVTDRGRFERLLQSYQTVGGLTDLALYSAIFARGIVALPAMLPFTGQALASGSARLAKTELAKKPILPVIRYTFVRDTEISGIPIRVFESRKLNTESQFLFDSINIAYLGDTVVLTSSLEAMREVLANASSQNTETLLSTNSQFKKASQQGGDVVYFSELNSAFMELKDQAAQTPKTFESGSLKFVNSSWLNTHRLDFEESEWAKPFQPFRPKDLVAPRELMPATTIAYFLTKVDLASAWLHWSKLVPTSGENSNSTSPFALDLKNEVLPELGPEVGLAFLDPPAFLGTASSSWLMFSSLKSAKLSDAFTQGKLFKDVGPTTGVAEVKFDSFTYFVTLKSGFLVVANNKQALATLNQPAKLNTTRDYSKAADKITNDVVAFGGYNLEAAIAASRSSDQGGLASQQAEVIFSIAGAFHSQSFSATVSSAALDAQSSVAMDREGRYGVAEFSNLPEGRIVSFGTLQPSGIRILDQQRLSSIALRIKSKGAGAIDNIRDDIKSAEQSVDQKNSNELILRVNARRSTPDQKVSLPITDPAFAPYLKSTGEFSAANEDVVKRAREIAGDDKDAWSVARKLADWTFKNLEWRYVADADASTTLATKEADCSEFSQLFVSMARSVGLPARIVSGLAYSGSSFGGHAWVEVWVGRWVELDPTWGTEFVDATHIRSESSALVTSAALNLIDVEIIEAKRTAAPFQASASLLGKELIKALPTKGRSTIEASLDLSLLTDNLLGAGSWSRLSEAERDQLSGAYSKLVVEILLGYGPDPDEPAQEIELLRIEEKGDTAVVLCLQERLFLKLRLVRSNGAWYLVEIVQTDTALHLVRETLLPAFKALELARAGQKPPARPVSDFARALLLVESKPQKALEIVESALKLDSKNQDLRLLKAIALINGEKEDDALKILSELSTDGYAPAVIKLATWKYDPDAETSDEVIALYRRYAQLEPADPRPHQQLASILDESDKPVEAEAEYRKVIELTPESADGYASLIGFLVSHGRASETGPLLNAGEKYNEDLFSNVMYSLYFDDVPEIVKFAALNPQRLKSSFTGHMALANFHNHDKKYPDALRVITAAKKLDPTSTEPYVLASEVLRAQSQWRLALREADQAIGLDNKDGTAHYERACSLAKLRRHAEAIAALERSIEISPFYTSFLAEEEDLKPLAALPAFKKLLPKEEEEKP